VSAEAGLSGVTAALTPLEVGSAAKDTIPLTTDGTEHPASVAPGYYRLTVKAFMGAQPLIRREVVHIYSFTETSQAYHLTEADFASQVYLAGTLSGSIDGYTPVAALAYEDEACDTLIDESAVTGDDDAWGLAVEAASATVWFKVQLEKDGSVKYYSKPIPVTGLTASGKMDIPLPVAGYTITFDANGGVIDGGGSSMTMTAPENGTLTLPTATLSQRDLGGWYDAGGKPFTGETPVSGNATVYAKWLIPEEDIGSYLSGESRGTTPTDPIPLAVSLYLANSGWTDLLSKIAGVGKYVSLDLSACTMDGTEFDPGTEAGAAKITALVLPDTAESIKAGTNNNAAFKAFTGLAAISGAGVKTIGDWAFYNCTGLRTVSLPAAQNISSRDAFNGCTDLTVVSLPAAKTIGYRAFAECTSLTTVSLLVAQTIGDWAFYNCTSLTTVSLPAAQTIGDIAFNGCTDLTEVSLPAAQTFGHRAFAECTSLTTVSLPEAQTIGTYVFIDCTNLETVSLPVATAINGSAFSHCPNLRTITVDPANAAFTAYDGMLLNKAGTTLIAYPSAAGDITLPAITTIGDRAFYGCTGLTTVTLPKAETIGDSAFYHCTGLTEVSLLKAKTIVNFAFYRCTGLTTVSLPKAQTIGYRAFADCTSLTTVSLPAAPPSISFTIFSETAASGTITVRVPPGTVPAYTSAWDVTAETTANGNTSVYGDNHKAVTITDVQ
jgi:hypothetical protein